MGEGTFLFQGLPEIQSAIITKMFVKLLAQAMQSIREEDASLIVSEFVALVLHNRSAPSLKDIVARMDLPNLKKDPALSEKMAVLTLQPRMAVAHASDNANHNNL